MFRPEIVDLSLQGISQICSVEYGNPNGIPQLMDIIFDYNSPSPMPTIIWIHGGGFTEEEYTRFSRPEKRFAELAKLGFLIASIDYRLAQVTPFPAQIQDCKCAVRFLRSHAEQFGIDPEHIGVWGESCGGQLAALMSVQDGIEGFEDAGGWEGVSSNVQAAVAWYGGFDTLKFTHMLEDPRCAVMYGGPWQVKKELIIKGSPITYASRRLCPILSMCSDTDQRVPYQQSVDFCKEAQKYGNDAMHFTVPKQGHGYFVGEEYYQMIYRFFSSHLK